MYVVASTSSFFVYNSSFILVGRFSFILLLHPQFSVKSSSISCWIEGCHSFSSFLICVCSCFHHFFLFVYSSLFILEGGFAFILLLLPWSSANPSSVVSQIEGLHSFTAHWVVFVNGSTTFSSSSSLLIIFFIFRADLHLFSSLFLDVALNLSLLLVGLRVSSLVPLFGLFS